MFSSSKKVLSAFVAAVLLCSVSAFAEGFVIKENEKCISFNGNAPFVLDPWADSILMTVGVGASAGSFIWEKQVSKTATSPSNIEFDLSSVNKLDAAFAHPYSKALHLVGTGTCGMNLVIMPAAVFATELIMGNLPWQDVGTIVTMYAEAFFLAYGIKDTLKMAVHRARPYMYFPGQEDPKKIVDGEYDWSLSFPSGHTTNAFMGASFLSYVFCKYYPESNFRIPVVATSFTFAVATGVLRVLSGNHFVTDVCTGALIGSVCGFGVPFIHSLIAESKYGKANAAALNKIQNHVAVSPFGVSVKFDL